MNPGISILVGGSGGGNSGSYGGTYGISSMNVDNYIDGQTATVLPIFIAGTIKGKLEFGTNRYFELIEEMIRCP